MHTRTHTEKRHTVHKDKEELCTGIHAWFYQQSKLALHEKEGRRYDTADYSRTQDDYNDSSVHIVGQSVGSLSMPWRQLHSLDDV